MRYFWATIALCLGTAAAVNYYVDVPRRFLRRQAPPPAVWPKGHVLVIPEYFDERAARRSILSSRGPLDLLILGSSRAMLAGARSLRPGISFYNASLSGAALEDYAALWELVRSSGNSPRRTILFLDSWAVNDNTTEADWDGNADLAGAFLRRRGAHAPYLRALVRRFRLAIRMADAGELLNWHMIKLSVGRLTDGRIKRGPLELAVVPAARRPGDSYAWRTDGSRVDWKDERPAEPDAARREALEYAGLKDVYPFGRFRPDKGRQRFLEELVDDISSSSPLLVIVPPFHPAAEAAFAERPDQRPLTPELIALLEKLASGRPRVRICDASRAAAFKCSESEFMDAMHMRSSCADKVLRRCLHITPGWTDMAPQDYSRLKTGA